MDSTKELIEYLKAQRKIFDNADEFECVKVKDYEGRVYTLDTSSTLQELSNKITNV